MNEPPFVSIVQRLGHGGDQLRCLSVTESTMFQSPCQRRAIDVFCNQIAGKLVIAAKVIHRHDVGVVQMRNRFCFRQIDLGILRSCNQFRVRYLNGHGSIQAVIISLVDQTKATLAD